MAYFGHGFRRTLVGLKHEVLDALGGRLDAVSDGPSWG
jgi:hypothetical protein